jgi:hypothetical protein
MKAKLLIGILLVISLMLLAGCSAPTCYPPNKILDNKCCIDDDDNTVCDYEEGNKAKQPETPVEETPAETAPAEETPEPQIQKVKIPEPAQIPTGLQLGKQQIKMGESRKYIEINQMSTTRTSRDKGIMNFIVFTVRNTGETKLNPVVELLFEGARVEEYTARVRKEYVLQALNPGEKLVINQSMGIRFANINLTKEITMAVYERYSAPRKDLEVLKKTFIPTDYMASMEIFTFGPEDVE